ncbi:MAG TPA: ABC transporter permease [Chitinophagaceae bacterium]|nr:ABC transporter permease [Chitinophagaceae bacterium]
MSLLISTKAEIIKTKRSASFWLSLVGAAVIPVIFFLVYTIKPEKNYARLEAMPWEMHFLSGFQAYLTFLLPMFVILICSLIPQIEFKNNTWKQVFASPQSVGNIFLSKYIAIVLMVLFLFLMFNLFMVLAGIIPNLFYSKFTFLDNAIRWMELLKLNIKSFVSLLGIIAFQYWLSLRFKNFIVPIGIGLGLLVMSMIVFQFHWEHIAKVPYAHPMLTFNDLVSEKGLTGNLLKNHELNAIGYFIFFSLLAFLDMRFRKERG